MGLGIELIDRYFEMINDGKIEEAYHRINTISDERPEIIYLKAKIVRLIGSEIGALPIISKIKDYTQIEPLSLQLAIRIEKLFCKASRAVNEEIDEISELIDPNKFPVLQAELHHLRYLSYDHGFDYEVKQDLEKALEIYERLDYLFFKAIIHIALSFVNLIFVKKVVSHSHINHALSIGRLLKCRVLQALASNSLGNYLAVFVDPNQSISSYQKTIEIREKIVEDKLLLPKYLPKLNYHNLSVAYLFCGEIYKAIESIEYLVKNVPKDAITCLNLSTLGSYSQRIGNYVLAKKYFSQELDLALKRDNQYRIIDANCQLANISILQGDMKSALAHMDDALMISNTSGIITQKIYIFYWLAEIHFYLMDYSKAKKYLDKLFDVSSKQILFERIDIQGKILLGRILYNQDDLEESKFVLSSIFDNAYQELIDLFTIRNHENCIRILPDLIAISVEENNIENANQLLEKFEELKKMFSTKLIDVSFNFTKALVLRLSGRGKGIFKAQELLNGIIEGEMVDFNLTIRSILYSIDILFMEIKFSDSLEDVLGELLYLVQKLQNYAELNEIHSLNITSKVVLSYVSLIKNDPATTKKLQEGANLLAEKYELQILADISSVSEIEKIVTRWQEILIDVPAVKDRIEELEVQKYLEKAIKHFNKFKQV